MEKHETRQGELRAILKRINSRARTAASLAASHAPCSVGCRPERKVLLGLWGTGALRVMMSLNRGTKQNRKEAKIAPPKTFYARRALTKQSRGRENKARRTHSGEKKKNKARLHLLVARGNRRGVSRHAARTESSVCACVYDNAQGQSLRGVRAG